MRRDLEIIRTLLLEIEAGKTLFETLSSQEAAFLHGSPHETRSQEVADKVRGHLDLLQQEGLIEIEHASLGHAFLVKGLTPQGHNLLDSIRDPEIWRKTRDHAPAATRSISDLRHT